MIENVSPRNELLGLSRKFGRSVDWTSVREVELDDYLKDGWTIRRKGKVATALQRPRPKAALLESRVWTLFYKMNFSLLSGEKGAQLQVNTDTGDVWSQVDVCAIDEETAICCECKSAEIPRRDGQFQDKIGKLALKKKPFAQAVAKIPPKQKKRHCGYILWTWDIQLSDNDRQRAAAEGIVLFDHSDLEYFEALTRLLGPAARFQFLAEVFRNKKIAGLNIRVPALRMTAGSTSYYMFALRPDYLLKIGYVAHRAKGKSIDVESYQRMISKGRLKSIAEYISDDGMFPTNIVLNFEQKDFARWERGKQEGDDEGASMGWLTLSPTYGSAWIIDGQHRLYAYSGHPRASTSSLSVLGFAGLSPSRQAELFVNINSEQKAVKRSLLVELDAVLKWESEVPEKRVDAIVSRLGLKLDQDPSSPLFGRVLLDGVTRNEKRCVTLNTLTSALDKPGLFIASVRKGQYEWGPLWRDDPNKCYGRATTIISRWLLGVAQETQEWWDAGSGEGGGLAMNNGVSALISLLRSVLEHTAQTLPLFRLDDSEVADCLQPYAKAVGEYLSHLSPNERKAFRELQGAAGQNTLTRMMQEGVRKRFPQFNPQGLEEWIQRRLADTNSDAKELCDQIEELLQSHIIGTLKENFGEENDAWWFLGVPENIRKNIALAMEEKGTKAGLREQNFNLIHYRDISQKNWKLFSNTVGIGKATAKKEDRTKWLVDVGNIRNDVSHKSRGAIVTLEQVSLLKSYYEQFSKQVETYEGEARDQDVEDPSTDELE